MISLRERKNLTKREFELDRKVKEYRYAGDNGMEKFCLQQLRHVQSKLYGWRSMRDLHLKEKVDPTIDKAAIADCDGNVFDSPSAELVYRAKKHAHLHKVPYLEASNAVLEADLDLARCYNNFHQYIW
jgi:hypothetical protein